MLRQSCEALAQFQVANNNNNLAYHHQQEKGSSRKGRLPGDCQFGGVMNLRCCVVQELKSFTIDSESIVGGGGGEKDDDFMFDLQEISPRKLATIATTTQESASYSTRKIWATTT